MGYPETRTRIHDPVEVQLFVDTMLKHGHVTIDTAQNYGNGTSERVSLSLLKENHL